MENILYNEKAMYYDIIANDRNFTNECEELVSLYSQLFHSKIPSRIMELFAGPAYHSEIFSKKYKSKVLSIDSSMNMKNIACQQNRVNESNYIVGSIPSILINQQGKFDLILIMRYSIGLITYDESINLFKNLEFYLADEGVIIIELHKVSNLINGYANIDIKSRKKIISRENEEIVCTWPSGQIEWNEDTWKVTMPIKLEIINFNGNGKSEIVYSKSEEYIYLLSDIQHMLFDLKLKCKKIALNNFNNSIIVIVTWSHHEN